jgi:hypothetical protein
VDGEAGSTAALCGYRTDTGTVAHPEAEIDVRADRALKAFNALNPTNRELAGKAVGMLICGKIIIIYLYS